jgi:hypothetical protein
MRIDQIVGDRDSAVPPARGDYYPGAESPRFRRITVAQMQRSCQERYGAKAFSAVNFSFFEEYDDSTRLSFPIQTGGALISAGSSPYGPVAAPKHPHYRTVELKAMQWTGSGLTIGRYDPGTGAPLSQPGGREAVVTYAYTDHPSYVLNRDPPNRYQLLGGLDADGRDGAEHLLVVTVERATLAAAADLLRAEGATGDILTFDGGVSTFLWSGTGGTLVSPTNRDGALPHYLCIHSGQ